MSPAGFADELAVSHDNVATAEDVAACVVFLASAEAAMVNCHTLSVDGGWTAW